MRWNVLAVVPSVGGAACVPFANRSEPRACAPAPPPTCALCANGALDDGETDVDCGGGVADDAPVGGWPSLGAAIAWLFPGGMPLPPPPPPLSACPRCGLGRACTAHTDCDRNEGHLCARLLGAPVCAPWWVVNATAFVQVRPSATVEGAQTPCCAHS